MDSNPKIDRLLEQATQNHRAGDLAGSRRLYAEALSQDPAHPVALVRSGLLEMQEGHIDEAIAHIQRAIVSAPKEPRYEFVLGEVLASVHRWEEAAAAYRRSLAIDPRAADARVALGTALQSAGDLQNAIVAFEAAADLLPNSADTFNRLGHCHQLLGDQQRAEAAYRRSLQLQPDSAEPLSNLGALLTAVGRLDEAIPLLRRAIELEPNATAHPINLGVALCSLRDFAEAEQVLRPIVERHADIPEAAYNLGNALSGQGRLREAVEQFQNALLQRPGYVDVLNNLGNAYKELGEIKLAMAAFEEAIKAHPGFVVAMNNLACLQRSVGKLEEAEATLRRALQIDPRLDALHNNLGNVLKDIGEIDQAIACFQTALVLNPASADAHGNLAYALSFRSLDGKAVLEECLRFNARHAEPLRGEIRTHANERSPDRRLRIGYVSPDFRDHCQSFFTIPLLSHHDHAGFEIYCYSSVERPDERTRRIASFADHFREVRPLDDATLSELIRADRIDIAVDLTMHMANGRPLLFARKPAPLQVAWLAYPGATGLAAMDYRLSDPRLDPPEFDDQYSEKTIRLPDSFWCYDPLTTEPAVNALPALARGYVTFGCLNNPCKLTDDTLRLWSGAMAALPQARLLLMAWRGSHRERLIQRLQSHGIAPERVRLLPHQKRDQYLRSYHEIDLGLDTFPYNGHTTSLDSMWMGVPVITRVGKTCVGRGGLSQLFQLNLLELAAETDQGFVDAAVALAGDLPRLAQLRQGLRSRLAASPLMDGERFARNMESAYRRVWKEYCMHAP